MGDPEATGMYFVTGGELEYWRSALVDPIPIQTGRGLVWYAGSRLPAAGGGSFCFLFLFSGEAEATGSVKWHCGCRGGTARQHVMWVSPHALSRSVCHQALWHIGSKVPE